MHLSIIISIAIIVSCIVLYILIKWLKKHNKNKKIYNSYISNIKRLKETDNLLRPLSINDYKQQFKNLNSTERQELLNNSSLNVINYTEH